MDETNETNNEIIGQGKYFGFFSREQIFISNEHSCKKLCILLSNILSIRTICKCEEQKGSLKYYVNFEFLHSAY